MLATPGRSPRQISLPNSPAPSSLNPNPNPQIHGHNCLPSYKKSRVTVLDEDTYVAAIERIIERDYFPDIPKLQEHLDWISAVRSGDPLQIRDVQLKIAERRRAAGKSDSVVHTARSVSVGSPWDRSPVVREIHGESLNSDAGAGLGSDLSLDAFFGRYTSEDNESFNKILEKVNRKRKERYGYLLEGEKGSEENAKRITDGFGTSGQPVDSLEGWKFTPKNLLMYGSGGRDEAPLTEAELAERMKGETKEIERCNTRFNAKPTEESTNKEEENPIAILYTPVKGSSPAIWSLTGREMDKGKKYDLEDMRRTPEPGKGGYSFVRTPSPNPGADGSSPFMTWGEIEGTPLRLNTDELTEGPQFKMPALDSRDVKAHNLSREAGRKLREKSKLFGKSGAPLPRGRSMSPGVQILSPAAQKFVKNAMAKAGTGNVVDETLRASYRASPLSMGTPKTARRSTSRLGEGSTSPSWL